MTNKAGLLSALSLLLAFVLGMASIPCQAAAKFHFKTLDVPEASRTAANGNIETKIVGEFDDIDGNTHGFILDRKRGFSQFDVPGAVVTTLNMPNHRNQYAGIYVDAIRPHGYFLDKKGVTTLDPPDSIRSQATGINDLSQVVGSYRDPSQKRHGFVWWKGKFTTFNVPNDDPVLGTVPIGINNRGQVIGSYVNADDGIRHGFVRIRGDYKFFDVPGAQLTIGETINNKGQIVGLFVDALNSQHGFLLNKGRFTTIDFPGSTATAAFSIDDEGTIVGTYDDSAGVTHGFVARSAHD